MKSPKNCHTLMTGDNEISPQVIEKKSEKKRSGEKVSRKRGRNAKTETWGLRHDRDMNQTIKAYQRKLKRKNNWTIIAILTLFLTLYFNFILKIKCI